MAETPAPPRSSVEPTLDDDDAHGAPRFGNSDGPVAPAAPNRTVRIDEAPPRHQGTVRMVAPTEIGDAPAPASPREEASPPSVAPPSRASRGAVLAVAGLVALATVAVLAFFMGRPSNRADIPSGLAVSPTLPTEMPEARVTAPTDATELAPPPQLPNPLPSGVIEPKDPPGKRVYVANVRATIDASPSRVVSGQLVEFTARVRGAKGEAKGAEGASFSIAGPGLPNAVKLPGVMAEAGAYHASLTLFEAGRYDVVFEGRVDGSPLRAQRTLDVAPRPLPRDQPHEPSPATSPATSPTNSPSGSAKWL